MNCRKLFLSLECLILFVGIPGLLVWFEIHRDVPFFSVLFGFLGLTLLLGWRDPDLKFNPPSSPAPARKLLLRLLAAALGLTVLTLLFYPDLLFRLPRERPGIWLMVMVLYPVLSVAPQEYLFRTYFMQRYRPLFGEGTGMLWVNALIFGWAHAFFLNPVAPLLSVLAGWLLAKTWQETKSFRRVCLEHAVYGQIVFTCGLGWFFYQGSTRALENLSP
ncbi:MAG: type II CAAX prenyl endopeptidase Rce1 family protein [Kiritimatiellia bacterium]